MMKDTDRKKLWGRSGNVCSFPNCGLELASSRESKRVLGDEAHIKGENPGSARYDPSQSEDERNGYENRILMCPTHHTMIDQDATTWTVENLKEMKARHERALEQNRQFPELIGALREMVRQFDANTTSVTAPEELIREPDGVRTIRVDARREEGVDTGIEVRKGQRISFFARGLITYDGGYNFTNPEGIICNELGLSRVVRSATGQLAPFVFPHENAYPTDDGKSGRIGRLIGWIGTDRSRAFRIGARRELDVTADGRLYLAVNDARGTYSDNDGEYRVDIRTTGGQK
jgi:hypothetical protein